MATSRGRFGVRAEQKIRTVIDGRLTSAWTQTARGHRRRPCEVAWFTALHKQFEDSLERDLAQAVGGSGLLPIVESVKVHGSKPFAVRPFTAPWPGSGETAEIGDLIFIVSIVKSGVLRQREALLLQMKVKPVNVKDDSTIRELHLYASWPHFWWASNRTAKACPAPHVRCPSPGPCDAAQIGVIPIGSPSPFTAYHVSLSNGVPGLEAPGRDLASEVACVLNLNLGIDATLRQRGCVCWPQIVEDIRLFAGDAHRQSSRDIFRRIGDTGISTAIVPLLDRYITLAQTGQLHAWRHPWSRSWRAVHEPNGYGDGDGSNHEDDAVVPAEPDAETLVVEVTYADEESFEIIPRLAENLLT